MNQAIIINDDHEYNNKEQCWQFTGILSGEKILIKIFCEVLPSQLSQEHKFDWECDVEDWLETNEPINSIIELRLK